MGVNHSKNKNKNYCELFYIHNERYSTVKIEYIKKIAHENIEYKSEFYIDPKLKNYIPIDVRNKNEIFIYDKENLIVHISHINGIKEYHILE